MIKARYLFPLILMTSVGLAMPTTASEVDKTPTPVTQPASPTDKTGTVQEQTTVNPENATIETRLVLKLKERRVYVFQGDKKVASYPVAIGKKGWETPTGQFQVIQMVEHPVWQNPWNGTIIPAGPNSPLGERWIGFWTDGKNYIGFHGTAGEHLIGQAVSHGCVRMRNKDVKALYQYIKMGTPVVVVP